MSISLRNHSSEYVRDASAASTVSSSAYKHVDYKGKNGGALAPHFIFECAIKLNMKPLTTATAAILYHRFFREVESDVYDEFLIASAALGLAGKLKDDPVKIRDVINVTHNTLHREAAPLELNDEYWAIRDALLQAELLLSRMLKFNFNIVHPHKYLLHYLKELQSWFHPSDWKALPIAKTAAACLQDFHHSAAILDYKPAHVAICCLSMALETYGVQVPLTDDFDETTVWYSIFSKDLNGEKHWEIMSKIMDVYNVDNETQKNSVKMTSVGKYAEYVESDPMLDYGTPEAERMKWRAISWLWATQRHQDGYINNVRYYGKPEGEDLLGKLVAINRTVYPYCVMSGAMMGLMEQRTTNLPSAITRGFRYFWPGFAMASTFAGVSYFATNLRGKDDVFNYWAGAIGAGTVCGAWRGSHIIGWGTSVVFLFLAGIQYGQKRERGWNWWNFDENLMGGHSWHKVGWDTFEDSGERGYTVSH